MLNNLWKNFVRSWRGHASMQFATLAVLAGTYTVISFSLLIHQNLEKILIQWGRTVQLSVYLDDAVEGKDQSKVEAFLHDQEIFEKVSYVSKEQAAQKFKKQMGSHAPDFLFHEDFGNPFPASFETSVVNFINAESTYQKLKTVATEVARFKGVEDVSFGQEWVKNYSSLLRNFSMTSWFLVFVLLSGSLFVVGNSIRSSIFQRREEIEILELVGGTSAYIRAPYIFEGTLMGAMASVLAIVLTYGLFVWNASLLKMDLGYWALGASISFLNWQRMAIILLVGMGFGALGSTLCVRKLSTGWSAAQRTEAGP